MRGTPPPGFVDFVVARGPSLHRTAILLTRDHHRAEDLVQTALARAWGSWDRVHSDHEAYVRRILVNEFASSWRRRWNDERPSEVLPEVATADHGDAVTDRSTLVAALALLPRRQRAVVVLRFFHDYSETMTADALGVTVGTVKSQTSKALATLRVSPGLHGPGGPEAVPCTSERRSLR